MVTRRTLKDQLERARAEDSSRQGAKHMQNPEMKTHMADWHVCARVSEVGQYGGNARKRGGGRWNRRAKER